MPRQIRQETPTRNGILWQLGGCYLMYMFFLYYFPILERRQCIGRHQNDRNDFGRCHVRSSGYTPIYAFAATGPHVTNYIPRLSRSGPNFNAQGEVTRCCHRLPLDLRLTDMLQIQIYRASPARTVVLASPLEFDTCHNLQARGD